MRSPGRCRLSGRSQLPAALGETCTTPGAAPGRPAAAVYARPVSDKPPKTYILHTVVLFAVLVTLMVVFLMHQWG